MNTHHGLSRAGETFTGRLPDLCTAIHIDLACRAVLDGEIVSLDQNDGRAQFYELLRHRRATAFYAFDVLWIDGDDVRTRPLLERKRISATGF